MMGATYRVQLSRSFPFAAAAALVPFFARLGVTHLYCSPLLAARPGSTHGYDVVDPTRLDEKLGGDAGLAELRRRLDAAGMRLLLDIVPNHAAASAENPFWDDVLAHGRRSRFASWFDIDWGATGGRRRILLPVLGDRRSRCLARGEITVVVDRGALRVRYGTASFPLEPASMLQALGDCAPARALRDLAVELAALPPAQVVPVLRARWESSPEVRGQLGAAADRLSARDRLEALLDRQAYRLVHWRRAAHELNYRRFFEVNDLVALRVEDPAVLAATHARILALVADGTVAALRVDHVDGLLDPAAYLADLAAAVHAARPPGVPVVVEKILARDERLRDDWPVAGTTGYEFLNALERVFIDPEGHGRIVRWYRGSVSGRDRGYPDVLLESKRRVLDGGLWTDVERMARLLRTFASRVRPGVTTALRALRVAIVEVVACLPVYRTYRTSRRPLIGHRDRALLERALATARQRARAPAPALDLLEDALLGDLRADSGARLAFVQRFQQTSGPAMAKGGEDTACYVWIPLLSLNEVGGEPDVVPRDAAEQIHRLNAARAQRWPGALSCTSTHDTKRSADVRARLDVLSEVPELWIATATRWRQRNRCHRPLVRSRKVPDANTEYLLYQTLVGVWPFAARTGPRDEPPPQSVRESLRERVAAYALKAAREAKTHTSHVEPDAEWEEGLRHFVDALFGDAEFLRAVTKLVGGVARPGAWNSLARTLIHCTAPGVPDIYQGDELWDFSLVDPDNRRPVDFAARVALLDDLERRDRDRLALAQELLAWPGDPRTKLHVIRVALAARTRFPHLFAGSYEPLRVSGRRSGHVLAFARAAGGASAVTIVPRLTLGVSPDASCLTRHAWSETFIEPPATGFGGLVNAITGQRLAASRRPGPAPLSGILDAFPLALLVPV